MNIDSVMRFLTETAIEDKIFVIIIFVIIVVTLFIAAPYLLKNGFIKAKFGGLSIGHNKEEEKKIMENINNQIKEDMKIKETYKNDPKYSKDINKKREDVSKNLKELTDIEIGEQISEEYIRFEKELEVLKKDNEEKEKTIRKLNILIKKYSADKTKDYHYFSETLNKIKGYIFSQYKTLLGSLRDNDSQIFKDVLKYEETMFKNKEEIISHIDKYLNQYSGEIIEEIESLNKLIGVSEFKKLDGVYEKFIHNLKEIYIKYEENIKAIKIKSSNEIKFCIAEFKTELLNRLEYIEESGGDNSLSNIEKLNYLFPSNKIISLNTKIMAVYNNLEDQKKNIIQNKQLQLVNVFIDEIFYTMDIAFKKKLIEKINKENIDITSEKYLYNNDTEEE